MVGSSQMNSARRNTLLLAVTSPLSWTFYRGLISHLREAGFDPVLLSSPGHGLQSTSEQEGVTSVAIPMEREIAPLRDCISLWKLYRAIRRIRPDIVDASTPKAGLLVTVAAWLARVPCRVYSLHGLRIETATGLKRSVLRWTERIATACSHQVFCLSPSLRDRAIGLNLVSSDKTALLKNGGFGVNLEQFAPCSTGAFETQDLRHRLGIPAGVPVMGFVGRFVKDKGLRQLLEAFDQLRQTYPELRLLMVGDFEDGDPVRPSVRHYIENTAAIIRPGFMSDTAPYFKLMDVCVLPTYREGFGQVSAEAQASGIPVVTTSATGAVDSVIDGITGIIVPAGDSDALAGAIGKLLEDPSLRTAMGRAGREWMERDFQPQGIWDHRVELYRELMSPTSVTSGIKSNQTLSIRSRATAARLRVLHITKTSDASFWAIRQVAELVRNGVDVHVALPSPSGEALAAWGHTGASLHFVDCSMPVRNPLKIARSTQHVRRLVNAVHPDIIHSHSVTTTMMLRLALGRRHPVPRIFQVPGPLHLEHWYTRDSELALAGENDFWIASSQFTKRLYEAAGVPAGNLFLSYYSADTNAFSTKRTGYLRKKLNIPPNALVVGNINLIYPPKQYLGHRVGLKCHEDVIEAISRVQRVREDVWGVLLGGRFGAGGGYEQKLQRLAKEKGKGQILMPGRVNMDEVALCWPDFDCAIHAPLSENCGGVVEPLLAGIPTIAGEVGGLPEVVQESVTGRLVPTRNPQLLAQAVLDVLDSLDEYKRMALCGRHLVSVMFDPERCSNEVLSIYRHILLNEPRPDSFNSKQFLHSDERAFAASM
jgi:glycosyltransferase involved in cell wall biosynthesis